MNSNIDQPHLAKAGAPFEPLESLMPIAGPALDAIATLFMDGWVVSVGWSAGKDSSALMVLCIEAARRAKRAGVQPRILVLTGDTGIENPEIAQHAKAERQKLVAMAQRDGLDLSVHVAMPSLSEGFALSILGGRALPSFAGLPGQCAQSWKVGPMNRLRREVLAEDVLGLKTVTLTGTRFSESERRGARMTARGDSATTPTINKHGDTTMCPIAHWSTDDVWELLGWCSSGLVDSYSDHTETLRIYAASGGTSCAVVSDMVSEQRTSRQPCGSRHGCSLCVAVQSDKSMEAMLGEERYTYMAGLNDLRNYIAATQFDFSRRNWIGRSIEGGAVRIGPGQYSPAEVLALTRYCMTLDALEEEAAAAAGIEPRFELLAFEQVVALDAMWSLNAMHPAFQAVKEWREIRMGAVRYPIPKIVAMPRRKPPQFRLLQVGADWEWSPELGAAGLTEPLAELAAEWGGGDYCMGHVTTGDGERVLETNTGRELEVDLESAVFAVEYDYDRMMERHEACKRGASWTSGYVWWVQRGAISVSASHKLRHHHALKRARFKELNGLAGCAVDLAALMKRTETQAQDSQLGLDLLAA